MRLREAVPPEELRSPLHICLSPDGALAYVVNHTAGTIAVMDVRSREVLGEIPVGPRPAHAAVSPDGALLYVTSLYGQAVDVVDLEQRRLARWFLAGYEPYGVTVSADGKALCVVNQISETAWLIDRTTGRMRAEVPVGRQPRYAVEVPGRGQWVVANGISRSLSIIDSAEGRVVETRDLGQASILRQLACTPDGRWCFVAHILSHDEQVTTQIERGWIHSNGFTAVDLTRPGHRVTLLLDRLLDGASNPWGVALSADGARLYVTLAGVHEVAFVDVAKALSLVAETGPERVKALSENVEIVEQRGIARRFETGGEGPRGLALSEATGEVLVANYFSDTISFLDARTGAIRAVVPLGPAREPSLWRRGEMLFNDARITYQRWFSCASCHQEDATVDGLNWDLLNDGAGNPKNVKSLHDAHDTPPAMWTRVREDMNAGVAAGQRFAGFLPEPENHKALLAFLGAPPRAANPYRARDPEAVKRGARAFSRAGCHYCHPPPKYTNLRTYDLRLANETDLHTQFDVPSLRDCYRTAPYLHDGRARTLEDIFRKHDPDEFHGTWSILSEEEFRDLMEFVRSL